MPDTPTTTDVMTTTGSPISAPSSTTRAMADLIGKFTNRLEDKPGDFRRKLLSASLAPVGAERDALERRRAELQASLVATPGEEASDVIYAIFVGSDTFCMDGRETDAKVAVYAQHLEGQPTWAIEEARRRFGKGGWKCRWNGRGVPTPENINAECAFILLDIETEIARLGTILDAELVDHYTSEGERQENLAKLQALLGEIAETNPPDETPEARAARDAAEQIRANEGVRRREAEALARAQAAASAQDAA